MLHFLSLCFQGTKAHLVPPKLTQAQAPALVTRPSMETLTCAQETSFSEGEWAHPVQGDA